VRVDVLLAIPAGRGRSTRPDRPNQSADQPDDWRRIGTWADTVRGHLENHPELSPGGALCGRRRSDITRACLMEYLAIKGGCLKSAARSAWRVILRAAVVPSHDARQA